MLHHLIQLPVLLPPPYVRDRWCGVNQCQPTSKVDGLNMVPHLPPVVSQQRAQQTFDVAIRIMIREDSPQARAAFAERKVAIRQLLMRRSSA
jgi:hypothetical protein